MKKLDFLAHTLDDKILKDGLSAISELDSYRKSKGLYSVVGGIGIQSYLPSSCRRATFDLDLMVCTPLNYSDFKSFSKPVKEYLEDNSYSVDFKKAHLSFNLEVSLGDEGGQLLIEFSRRNNHSFEEVKDILFRELECSRKKIVEGRTDVFQVCSPEDLTAPKLVRDIGILERNPDFLKYLDIYRNSNFSDEIIRNILKNISNLRNNVIVSKNPIETEKLRFSSDIYDIRILYELAGFNIAYFSEVINRWSKLNKNFPEKENLTSIILPNLFGNQ